MKPAEDYILNQPEPFRSILLHLQVLIESTLPELELRFKWKVPYYYLHDNPFCYMNVSHKKGYVDVGFWASLHLTKFDEFLVSDGRKIVKSLRYFTPDAIHEDILFMILEEAYKVNHKGFWKK